tara:strand:+ start:8509 stop:8715 length:207 start_codon:yes stop_codon:yes gene_type:complete
MRPRNSSNSTPVGPLYSAQKKLASDLNHHATTVGGLVFQGLKTEEDKKKALRSALEASNTLKSMEITK